MKKSWSSFLSIHDNQQLILHLLIHVCWDWIQNTLPKLPSMAESWLTTSEKGGWSSGFFSQQFLMRAYRDIIVPYQSYNNNVWQSQVEINNFYDLQFMTATIQQFVRSLLGLGKLCSSFYLKCYSQIPTHTAYNALILPIMPKILWSTQNNYNDKRQQNSSLPVVIL